MNTTVKLCGLRGTDDAAAAALAGADALGLVLIPGTRRYVPPPLANAMVAAIRDTASRAGRFSPEIVGVIAPMSLAVVAQLPTAIGVDALQLVGDDEECVRIAEMLDGSVPLIRTIGVTDDADVDAVESLARVWEQRGARVTFDAQVDGELGGTGHRIPTQLLRPLVAGAKRGVAGGLAPENVAGVVRDLAPAMVDVSSGVEASVGRKDAELMRAFVAAVRSVAIDDIDLGVAR